MPWSTLSQETGATRADLRWFLARKLVQVEPRQVWRDPLAGKSFVPVTPPRLTADQEAIWRTLARGYRRLRGHGLSAAGGDGQRQDRAVSACGATGAGSGARRDRARARDRAHAADHPPLWRAPSGYDRRHAQRAVARVNGYDQWRRVRNWRVCAWWSGARSAIFSPVRNLGLIVLDEEHEWTYKQDRSPMYHARDVALQLGRLTGATVILGSATPSLESAYRAERGQLLRLSLPKRIMGHRRRRGRAGRLRNLASAMSRSSELTSLTRMRTRYTPTCLPCAWWICARSCAAGNAGIFSRALAGGVGRAPWQPANRRSSFVNRRGSGFVRYLPRLWSM